MSEQTEPKELNIAPFTLVAVLPEDGSYSISEILWGQVLGRTEDKFRVHTGKFCKGVIYVPQDLVIHGIRMTGLCSNPQHKFVDEEPLIWAVPWALILNYEGRIGADWHPPTIPPKTGWRPPIKEGVLSLILPDKDENRYDLHWGIILGPEKMGTYAVKIGWFPLWWGVEHVRSDRIVPIYQTDKKCKYPRHALRRLRGQLQKALEMRMWLNESKLDEPLLNPLDPFRVAGKLIYDCGLVLSAD